MSDYLSNLISRSFNYKGDIRPRLKSIFEPRSTFNKSIANGYPSSNLSKETANEPLAANEFGLDENLPRAMQNAELKASADKAIQQTAITAEDSKEPKERVNGLSMVSTSGQDDTLDNARQDKESYAAMDKTIRLTSSAEKSMLSAQNSNSSQFVDRPHSTYLITKKEEISRLRLGLARVGNEHNNKGQSSDIPRPSSPEIAISAIISKENPSSTDIHHSFRFVKDPTINDSSDRAIPSNQEAKEELTPPEIISEIGHAPKDRAVSSEEKNSGALKGIHPSIDAVYSKNKGSNITKIKISSSESSSSESESISQTGRKMKNESEPSIHVTIGRVEVRAIMPPAPNPNRTARSKPGLSLDDYLKRMSGGKQ